QQLRCALGVVPGREPVGSSELLRQNVHRSHRADDRALQRSAPDIRQREGCPQYRVELESRRSLASLTPRLKEFGVSANFTFVDSNIEIRPEDATIITSQSRPLLGQSRYIANGVLQWTRPKWHSDAKFFANYVSRRVSDVGTFRLPDIYQEGNTFLDFVYQYALGEKGKWGIRFEAENLLDNDYRWTQASFVQRDFRLGRNFQIGMSYTFF